MRLKIGMAALLLGAFVTTNANAGTFANTGSPAGVGAVATEIFGTGSNTTKVPSTKALKAVYSVATTSGNDLNVTYTLGGGATWGTQLVAGDLLRTGAGTPSAPILVSGGNTTDTTVVYRINGGVEPTTVLTLSYNVQNATSLATEAQKITLGITLKDLLGDVDTAASLDALTSKVGTKLAATPTSDGTLYIDVTSPSLGKFFGGTSADIITISTQKVGVKLGNVSITDNSAYESDLAVAWAAGVANATATGTFTLTGQFSGLAATNPLFISMDGSGTFNATNDLIPTSVTPTTATWTLTNANLLALKAGGLLPQVCLVFDGTSSIPAQTPTASLAITWTNGTYKQDTLSNQSLRALAKNSATLQSPWINASSASASSRFVLTNMSSNAIGFKATAFNEAGTAVAPVAPYNDFVSISPKSVLTIGANKMFAISTGQFSVQFEFLGSAADVQGVYQYYNLSTGLLSSIPLTAVNK